MSFTQFVERFWQDIAAWAVLLDIVVTVLVLVWVLHLKRETMSAIAWSLTVLLVPFLGALLFFLFGYQWVERPLRRKQERLRLFKKICAWSAGTSVPVPRRWRRLARLAEHTEGFPVTAGNRVTFYHDGAEAFAAMQQAIAAARNHVHIQFFIFRSDRSGAAFLEALCAAARRGVTVRFLYDSIGAHDLSRSWLQRLRQAGGHHAPFLPVLNPLYRLRVNLRNHRKILVVDGRIAFTGGFNIGDEYLGLQRRYGYWRDTHLRLEGPAVAGLQRVFLEDWHFASNEAVQGEQYYPKWSQPPGQVLAQVVASGPDSEYKAIRETYFAAIVQARQRVWLASPYFVPDLGLRDALCLAARSGVDVRFLTLFRPDKWLPFLAARFYWNDLLDAGGKIYQYLPGMLHCKCLLVDGQWASVGTANFDNRSLFLNFEVNCQFFDPAVTRCLEEQFLRDLAHSVRVDPDVFARRPWMSRIFENAARLFSPVL
ncbi:MAG: cardiolipin synthase [Gemmataceae bacterium]|nr:cardiolipin synthase [Gemmataceae bacterium]